MTVSPGTRLGPYEIVSPLGAGGMGEVYRARDTRLGREVAIKVLPERVAASPELRERFEREARAVASLSHPGILAIHDFGTEGGTTFAAMELLEGETLRERLAAGPLSPRRATELALQLAQALAAAHDKGVVHRDVKPESVFLTREGRVKVLDFGLARQAACGVDGEGWRIDLQQPVGAAAARLLPPIDATHGFCPWSWSPDGHTLAGVASDHRKGASDPKGPRPGIYLLSLEPGTFRRLRDWGAPVGWLGSTRLIVETDGPIQIVDIASGAARSLLPPETSHPTVSADLHRLTWVDLTEEEDVWMATLP
jgi:serine/threonine protein kinase